MRRCAMLLVLVFLAGCRRGAPADPVRPDDKTSLPKDGKPAAKPGIAAWKPDAEFLDQLEPSREILPGCFMRLPKNYRRHKGDNLKATNQANWEGPARADGNNTQLMIQIITMVNPKDPKYAPRTVLTNHLSNSSMETGSIRKSPIEEGDLNRLAFIRGRSEGVDRLRKTMFLRDVAYLASDGNRLILISAHDHMSAKTDDFLGPAEAAILTFEKK